MNRFFRFIALTFVLAGCANESRRGWYNEYGTMAAGTPVQMQYGTFYGTSTMPSGDERRIAVLLPTTGKNAETGRAIRTSVENAVLQRGIQNLNVSFYDTASNPNQAISMALAGNPDVIIGPVFSANARLIREAKPNALPVLAFTTDAQSVGDGVLSMSLMPTNSVETIVKEMNADKVSGMIIVAPNTNSGTVLAGTARHAANIYDIPVNGIFFYDEQNSESIKNAMSRATINPARTAAHNRACEILSDILTHETLNAVERSSINRQLTNLAKKDTLGKLPYDAVLFLGNGDDTKSLASYIRYYGVAANDVRFYGTALWDGSDIASDITMTGAKFATLPPISESFINTYQGISGQTPSRIATFGYDATNMAIGMLNSPKMNAAYLLDPSGYVGIDGLFRLRPTGESERGLRIVALDGSGTVRDVRPAPTSFMSPIYNIEQHNISPARAMDLETRGINPLDYIEIPQRLRGKYSAKTYGRNITTQTTHNPTNVITILPEDDGTVITNPEYKPVALESVGRTYIDSVELED